MKKTKHFLAFLLTSIMLAGSVCSPGIAAQAVRTEAFVQETGDRQRENAGMDERELRDDATGSANQEKSAAGQEQESLGIAEENDPSGTGVAVEEAGEAQEEAGEAQEEAGVVQEEAGEAQEEAGVVQEEAGEAQKDAGEAQKDAGEAQEEADSAQGQNVTVQTRDTDTEEQSGTVTEAEQDSAAAEAKQYAGAEKAEQADAAKEEKQEDPLQDAEADVIIEQNGIVICKSTPAVESSEPLDETAPEFKTLSDALSYVRGQMIAREESVVISVPGSVFEQLDLKRYSDILAHTGDPCGGDYLLSAITSYGARYSASYSGTGEYEYRIGYYFDFKTNADEEEEADAEVSRLISSLGLKDGSKSDYDKVRAIHDYIVGNVEYDYDSFNGITTDYVETYTGYGAIVRHLAVCQGFSSMFYRLCLEAGIDARIINSNEMEHAWNIVQLDGLYYLMDCTWDENSETDLFFLRGKLDFSEHVNNDDQFKDTAFAARYPLSDYRYSYETDTFGAAPDYTLITQDNRIISTAAQNGRAKVLVFFSESCGNFLYTMRTLRGKEYDGVDFVYINMIGYRTEDQQRLISKIGGEMPADVPGTYAICSNGYNALREFLEITDLYDNSGYLHSASVFLIRPDNQIVYGDVGYAGEIGNLAAEILEDPDLPEAPEPGEDPYAGFTKIGLCGNNAVWRFYGEEGGAYGKDTLLINGSGKLWDNSYYTTDIGWLAKDQGPDKSYSRDNIQAQEVRNVIVGEGITYIGSWEFDGFTYLESITFKGAAPAINRMHSVSHDITIYYPEEDDSWKSVDRNLFSNGTRWISQDAEGVHHHKWGSEKVTRKATCTTAGQKEKVCTECGEKSTEAIPAAGHSWNTEYTTDQAATTTEEGIESIHCRICGAVKEGSERAIPVKPKESQELTVKPAAAVVVMGRTAEITVTGAQGLLTCTTEDPSVATAAVSGSKITVKGEKTGTVRMIVRAAETADHEAGETEFELNVVPGKTTRGDMFNLAGNVKVTWQAVPGAKYYKVYRTGVTNPAESLSAPVIVTTGLVGWDKSPGLTNGNAYRYRIVASTTGAGNPGGDSPLSYSKLMYRLKTVVIRSVKNTAPGKVTVKYDRSTSGDSYVLQYCEREDMVGAKTKVVLGADNTSYTIGGLKKGKTYYISIRVRKKVSGIDYYTTFGVAKKIKVTQ